MSALSMSSYKDKVVIVVSAPRSGSSWVARILRNHPDLDVYTHNTDDNHLLYAISPIRSLNPFGDDYMGSDNLRNELFLSIKSKYIKKIFKAKNHSKILTISTPTTATFLPALIKAFPNGKFIHLWRSPYDQILSFNKFINASRTRSFRKSFNNYKHHGNLRALRNGIAHFFHCWRWLSFRDGGYLGTRPHGFSSKKSLTTLHFLTWYYVQYNYEIKEALKIIPQERKHELMFDNLVSDFKNEFANLMEFFDIFTPPKLVEELAGNVRKNVLGKHLEDFSREEINNISRWLEEYN